MNISNEFSYIALFVSILLVVLGQVMVKTGSQSIDFSNFNLLKIFKLIIVNKYLVWGILFAVLAPVFYFIALINIDLSVAFGINALNYLFVSIAGRIIWKEEISLKKNIGLFLIVIGVIFIGM